MKGRKRIRWARIVAVIVFFTIMLGTSYYLLGGKIEEHGQAENFVSNEASLVETEVIAEEIEPNVEVIEEVVESIALNPDGKYIALTFDDGPSSKVTPRVLQTLKQHDAKATFFMLGNRVEMYPNIAAQVAAEGHEIANHTFSHPNLKKLTHKEMIEEIDKTNNIIEMATGITSTLFRPPYGVYNQDILNYTTSNNYTTILWSVDSLDWKSRNPITIKKEILSNVTNRSVVLMHDIHTATAEALPELLMSLKKEGYEFVTVSELLTLKEEKVDPYFGN
ncbi:MULTISPECIES: polysaccharide deacetylase family protein [unclassified Lysinibacillus]|uniref:polysaccharide deacetylase family protein n=1 Tax=unclassified Lysinibacillus TaxID=2636778 RepID=UPI003808F4FB